MASPETFSPASEHIRTPGRAIYALIGLGVLCFILFFYQLGSYPLFDVDEPRYAEAAREMIESGNWITPYFNYELRFDKPVLHYWLIALSYKAFGVNELAARLVSALTATATVLMVYGLGYKTVSPRFGLYSALILTTAVQFLGLSRMSITDMTLSCFMTATTLCLFLVAHRSLKWWLAAGLFSGLAILTKGPVGIVVPGAILFLYAPLVGRWKHVFLNRWFPLGVLIALSVAIPWYVLAWQQNGQIFLDALFLHNFTRYTDTVTGHDQPWWFFLLVIAVGFIPWSIFIPSSLLYWIQDIRKHHHTAVKADPTYRALLFSLVWVGFVLVFFSLSGTKLLTYILPLFPGLAMWMGATFIRAGEQTREAQRLRKGMLISAGLLFAIALVGGLVFVTNMGALLPREAKAIAANNYNYAAVAVLLLGIGGMTWSLRQNQLAQALAIQCAAMAGLGIIALQGILPNVSHATQGDLMRYVEQSQGKALITYEIRKPSLTYYSRAKVEHVAVDDQGKLADLLVRNNGLLHIITKNSFAEELAADVPAGAQLQTLDRGARYSLHSLTASPQKNP